MFGLNSLKVNLQSSGLAYSVRRALFNNNEQGLWYDLNDDATIFQDSAGTTLATWGDPVGLVLDKHEGDGRGVVNRLIHTNDVTQAVWASGSNNISRPSANTIVETVDNTSHFLSQLINVVSGLPYTKTVSLQKGLLASAPDVMQLTYGGGGFGVSQFANVNVSTGAVLSVAGGATCTSAADPLVSGAWTFTYTATATATVSTGGLIVAFCNNNPAAARIVAYIGSVAADCRVYRMQTEQNSVATAYQANGASVGGAGNHTIQSTAGSRPIRGRMPKRGRVNLYVNSESLAGYSNSGLVTSSTLSGFTSALQFGYDGATGSFSYGNASPVSSTAYRLSVFVQMDDNGAPSFLNTSGSSVSNDFCLVLANTVINPTTYTVALVSGSLYRVSVAATTGTVTNTNTGVLKFATNSSRTFKVTGRQLELGSTATAYQHVIDSLGFNVTESGQPSCGYLSYNGSNQWMQTAAAVNFSATDEMSVFAGVRKVSDAALASVIEFGTNAASAGGFGYFDPLSASTPNRTAAYRSEAALYTDTPEVVAPVYYVAAITSKRATPIITFRRNGVVRGTSVSAQGAGNYGNAVTYFGSRAGASMFYGGLMFSTIIRGALTSGTLLTRTEQYVARQTPTVNL